MISRSTWRRMRAISLSRSTDSASCTEARGSDDLRDFGKALRGFEREAFVSEDCVALLVDLMGVHEGLDHLVVRDTERSRRRRRADGQKRVPHLLPVPGVEVHHND